MIKWNFSKFLCVCVCAALFSATPCAQRHTEGRWAFILFIYFFFCVFLHAQHKNKKNRDSQMPVKGKRINYAFQHEEKRSETRNTAKRALSTGGTLNDTDSVKRGEFWAS